MAFGRLKIRGVMRPENGYRGADVQHHRTDVITPLEIAIPVAEEAASLEERAEFGHPSDRSLAGDSPDVGVRRPQPAVTGSSA
jgi:hypothetical protein